MNRFHACRFQRHKKADNLTVFFVLLGTASAKAAHKMLVILKPCTNFINILLADFMGSDPKSAKKTDSLFLHFRDLHLQKHVHIEAFGQYHQHLIF